MPTSWRTAWRPTTHQTTDDSRWARPTIAKTSSQTARDQGHRTWAWSRSFTWCPHLFCKTNSKKMCPYWDTLKSALYYDWNSPHPLVHESEHEFEYSWYPSVSNSEESPGSTVSVNENRWAWQRPTPNPSVAWHISTCQQRHELLTGLLPSASTPSSALRLPVVLTVLLSSHRNPYFSRTNLDHGDYGCSCTLTYCFARIDEWRGPSCFRPSSPVSNKSLWSGESIKPSRFGSFSIQIQLKDVLERYFTFN